MRKSTDCSVPYLDSDLTQIRRNLGFLLLVFGRRFKFPKSHALVSSVIAETFKIRTVCTPMVRRALALALKSTEIELNDVFRPRQA